MRQTTGTCKSPGEKIVKDIKRATSKYYSSEGKIRIVLDGLSFEDGQLGTPRHDCRPG
jgi:transposase